MSDGLFGGDGVREQWRTVGVRGVDTVGNEEGGHGRVREDEGCDKGFVHRVGSVV